MLFAGDDWAEDHHDIELQDEAGRVLVRARLPEGIAGITRLHALIGQFAGPETEPGEVAAGIETDRGLWVTALHAAGYTVYAINPRQVSRYRERHGTSGDILCAGFFPARFRMFIQYLFFALSDALVPVLFSGSGESGFPCCSGADAACPGYRAVPLIPGAAA